MAGLRAANASRSGGFSAYAAPDFRVFRYFVDDTGQIGEEPQATGVDEVRSNRRHDSGQSVQSDTGNDADKWRRATTYDDERGHPRRRCCQNRRRFHYRRRRHSTFPNLLIQNIS